MARKEDKYNKRRLQSSYLTSIVSTTLVLLMLGVLGLIVLHAQKLSNHVKENIGIRVIMKDDSREAAILQLQKYLDATSYTKSTEYITKEKAAEELKAELGEDFIDFLGFNPLPSSIDLRLNAEYANIESIGAIEKELLENKNVKEIYYQKSLVQAINQNVQKIGILLLGFSLLLLVIAIALINNTIRLSVYSKRFIIKSMLLVGATQSFIRRPFLIKGVVQGIYSAIIALILIGFILYFAQLELPELIDFQDTNLFIILIALVVVSGIMITWLSTYAALRKFLNMKTDDLYY
ncbi:MAG: cell division protein FtsX [Bacteroidetes bacterium HGW-Bacteroidetes-17]|nr:MAG: cell division protein FtsX [Bacteroidetes bacterium HGW-Bacteroidetes-17]